MLATFTLAVIAGAEDAPVIADGRFVPVFFFEVITGVWLLVKGVRVPATAAPASRP